MANEKEACNTLEGLFDMLAIKFKPQYNEMIKSLQFRKLYWLDSENVDEWMGETVRGSSRMQLQGAR